jgi:putative addiction module component (TIGR02574 family)
MVDTREIRRLSVSERLLLVEEIWDSIANDQAQVPVTPEVKAELVRRVAEHRANPSDVIEWSTVKADLERRPR